MGSFLPSFYHFLAYTHETLKCTIWTAHATITTFSNIYRSLILVKVVRLEPSCLGKGSVSCLILSRGRRFPPSLPCPGWTGIRKQLRTISSWYKRSASRNLGVNRHGTTLRQRVQSTPTGCIFSLLSAFSLRMRGCQMALKSFSTPELFSFAHD